MVSAIYILHWPDRETAYLRCELIMHRIYHNDVPDAATMVSQFTDLYRKLQPEDRRPCLYDHGVHYMYVWGENDVLIMGASRHNVNVMLAVTFLHQFHLILQHYFHKHSDHTAGKYDRDRIVDNFALVYELLDECMDFGMVQLTDYNILQEYIKMEINHARSAGHHVHLDLSESDLDLELWLKQQRPSSKKKKGKKNKKSDKQVKSTHNHAEKADVVAEKADSVINSSILRMQSLAVNWRPKGIFYLKNEIYIDIIEQSEFVFDLETGNVKTNEVRGVCRIRSYLSGMPQCKLGLNEKYISKVEYEKEDEEEEEEEEEESRPGNMLAPEKSPELENHVRRLKVPINNVQFHQCIELGSIYKENLILFTPPDGEFQLLSYTVDQQRRKDKKPLLTVSPMFRVVKLDKKLQVMCTLSSAFKKRLHCRSVVVTIPVDPRIFMLDDAASFRFRAELGDVRYSVDTSELVWAMEDLPGSKRTVRMMAELHLRNCNHIDASVFSSAWTPNVDVTDQSEDSAETELDKFYGVHGATTSAFDTLQKHARDAFDSNDVRVTFELPATTYSGLRITYLSVEEGVLKYTCFPWVRYTTRGDNRFRMGALNFHIE